MSHSKAPFFRQLRATRGQNQSKIVANLQKAKYAISAPDLTCLDASDAEHAARRRVPRLAKRRPDGDQTIVDKTESTANQVAFSVAEAAPLVAQLGLAPLPERRCERDCLALPIVSFFLAM